MADVKLPTVDPDFGEPPSTGTDQSELSHLEKADLTEMLGQLLTLQGQRVAQKLIGGMVDADNATALETFAEDECDTQDQVIDMVFRSMNQVVKRVSSGQVTILRERDSEMATKICHALDECIMYFGRLRREIKAVIKQDAVRRNERIKAEKAKSAPKRAKPTHAA
jgi:hypothetical protein